MTVDKDKVFKEVIEKYKEILKIDGFFQEEYKWSALKKFQDKPDLDADDFGNEVTSINYYNLIFQRCTAAQRHICNTKPEEYREVFRFLFDESIELSIRIKSTIEKMDSLYSSIATEESHQHYHTERELATFLTYKYPDKYIFYKDSFYTKLCKLLGVDTMPAKEKYQHYLNMVHNFIKNHVIQDVELISIYKKLKPKDGFKDDNYTLLAQDILYRAIEVYSNETPVDITGHKIYKLSMGSFSKDDFEKLLDKKRVAVHKNTKAKGRSSVTQGDEFSKAQVGSYFILNNGNDEGAIRIIGRFSKDKSFEKKDGWIEREFEVVARAIRAEKYDGESKWWTPNNNSTFIEIPPEDLANANELLFNKYFNVSIVNSQLTATSIDDTKIKELDMKNSDDLNQIFYGPPGTGKTFNTILEAVKIANSVFDIKQDRNRIKEEYERLVSVGRIKFVTFHQGMSYEDFIEGIKPVEPEKDGDPISYKIETGIFKKICIEASFSCLPKNNKENSGVINFAKYFDRFLENIEDRLEKGDLVELPTKNGKILVDSVSSQGNIIIKHVGKDRLYTISKSRLGRLYSNIPDLNKVENVNDTFREIIGGCNSSGYWAVLNQLNELGTNLSNIPEKTSFTFDEKLEAVKNNTNNEVYKNPKENFVIIIDEINRGNISQIFGELITLIEPSKRIGCEDELRATLPYSKELFGVPKNVFLVGTMNTADRSIEMLDIALRRRFSFKAYYPLYNLDAMLLEVDGVQIANLLKRINQRIEVLKDKDHSLGHSYFLNVESKSNLIEVFKHKVLPLLEEYFYNDFEKIGLILGPSVIIEDKELSYSTLSSFNSDIKGLYADKINYKVLDFDDWEKVDDIFKKIFEGK